MARGCADGRCRAAPAVMAALLPLTAWSGVSLDYAQTFGSRSYMGREAGVEVERESRLFAGAGFSSENSELIGGTFRTYSLRAGRRSAEGSWRLRAAVTPETDGYGARALGGGMRRNLAGRRSGGARLEGGLGLAVTAHRDRLETPAPAGGVPASFLSHGGGHPPGELLPRAEAARVVQTELSAELGLLGRRGSLTAAAARSSYRLSVAQETLREPPHSAASGPAPGLEGYPGTALYARAARGAAGPFGVWMSYGYTTYKAGPAAAHSLALGISVGMRRWRAGIEASQVDPSGRRVRRYLSLSLGWRMR